ncbi:hypothetical protein HBZS_103430 [Helicobacter bizzozeronii CCUG 35545]|nr:hypothetical protein HBZS_103430 [Helicobacter bizzozeronii CCUG 35545]
MIREIEGGMPPDDGGGGALPRDTPISGEGNKPPKGNDEHTSKEGNGGKEGNGDGGWNIKEIAKRQEGESDLEMRQRIKEAINERLPTLELNKKQNHHILGHKGYIEGRSYYEQPLDEEKIRELIRNGSVSIKKGKPWDEKIIIEHPDFEGVVLPHKKTSVDKPIRTRRSKVHFGNNGFHIVPYVGRKGRK